jgi:putative SOS response-associated peptidase YedK
MCGRYSQTRDLAKIAARFRAKAQELTVQPHYNFSPAMETPVVVETEEGRALRPMTWGITPQWKASGSKEGTTARPPFIINLRFDSLQKGSFRSTLTKRRCLVPADSFYEWRKGPGGMKIPVRFERQDGDLFAFAGIYEEPEEKDDLSQRAGLPPRATFCIFTTEPNALVKPVHNRMPIILQPRDEDAWLDRSMEKPEALLQLLHPYPAEDMKAYDVSPALNRGTEDHPGLIKPWTAPPGPTQTEFEGL